jgi:integrating conjugative element protein (TIGR03759 family)
MPKYITWYQVGGIVLLGSSVIYPAQATQAVEQRSVTTTRTDTRLTQHKKTEEEARRKQWHLTQTEWQRYKQLMQGIRGSISPQNISPIEVLGVHARNDKERQRYAETWARMRHDDAERILAFQYAYDKAFKKLYPNEQLIDVSKLKRPKSTMAGFNRILAFVNIETCPECEQTIQTLMSRSDMRDKQIDIYFVDLEKANKKDNQRIRQWAERLGLDRQRLKSGRITLNYDQGNLYRITRKLTHQLPIIFKANRQDIQPLSL